jgi:hypothetical protein
MTEHKHTTDKTLIDELLAVFKKHGMTNIGFDDYETDEDDKINKLLNPVFSYSSNHLSLRVAINGSVEYKIDRYTSTNGKSMGEISEQ